jgi:methyltransferase
VTLLQIVILLVTAQRVAELVIARRNTARLLAAGGHEVGAAHYPLFVLLHGAWLASLLLFHPAEAPVNWPLLGFFVLLQLGRAWVIASLAGRWTTRIIVCPDAPLCRGGPYRYLRHPNYVIVAGEIALLPLAFGAWTIALAFSALNLALLAWRIRVENRALEPLRRV